MIVTRPIVTAHDRAAVYAMTVTLPGALHRIDGPWRLASPALQEPSYSRLWEAADGTIVAWAVLQTPWHCLDFELRPGPDVATLMDEVLPWGATRLRELARERGTDLPFYASARADDPLRLAKIHGAGFAPAGWSYVHLRRDLRIPGPPAPLPAGFVIRSLAAPGDIAPYVATHRAAFGSTNMQIAWRQRTIEDPAYTADLDLVVEAPDGRIVAFCVGWITPPAMPTTGARAAQVEPLGVLPDFQRLGLGRVLLGELFRRARDLGATTIEVDAETTNAASQAAYRSVGFQAVIETPFALRVFSAT